ncbi:MAG: hypothetical protein OEV91_05835, partial [Desulfobulbaceae bacterium]|nr:hypothetical protein [Desulfobulbaceae bacterium]
GIAPGYVCMDMTRLALRRRFDAVVIPYNTMNLLTEPDGVERCLAGVRAHLHKGGRLLLQLFVPDAGHAALADKKQFQFRIFDCQDGSKVIKEILKWKEDNTPLFNLRETYRIRYRPDRRNEDWQYNYRILAWSHERWQQRLQEAGFAITASHGDYRFSPFVGGSHSTMLVAAKAV